MSNAWTNCFEAYADRELGEPDKSEWTVVKVEAYNGINKYLSRLENTKVKSLEDLVMFNKHNKGTEGAEPGDHPAFPSGQASNLIHLLKVAF